jgi:8-amino-7-oxononanoate synthase
MAAQIHAALTMARGMDAERDALQRNSESLRSALRALGWDTGASSTQLVPVIVGENEEALAAADFLQRQGFAVRAIRPPTVPAGTARLRFSLTAAIAPQDLVRLTESLDRRRASQQSPVTAGAPATHS